MPAPGSHRALLATLVAALLALLALGCGGDDDDEGAAERPATTAAETAPADGEEDEALTVEMSEFAFHPEAITVRRGATVTAENIGEVPHNLTLERPGTGQRVAGTPTIEAGRETTLEVDAEPGRYAMVCTVPGHREAGMVGEVAVR